MTLTDQLAGVPADRAVKLVGAPLSSIALALAAEGTGLAPVVATATGPQTTPGDFVSAALDDLERIAVELLPAWLPEAAALDRPDLGSLAAARMVAEAHAHRAHYAPSLLTDLAMLAMTGHGEGRHYLPLRTRGVQLARLVAEAFGRPRAVLLVEPAAELTQQAQDAIVAGAGWLAHNAQMPVWLIGTLPLSEDQIPFVRVTDTFVPPPAPIGKPHPGSRVEQVLEVALAAENWAGGRRWNQSYQSGPLSPPVRLDLLWPEERCVVELDGPEHCHPAQFEADRQRDVQLQLDGYAVLRFTNARVIHDVGAVVHQIGTYLQGRRQDRSEGRKQWPATT